MDGPRVVPLLSRAHRERPQRPPKAWAPAVSPQFSLEGNGVHCCVRATCSGIVLGGQAHGSH